MAKDQTILGNSLDRAVRDIDLVITHAAYSGEGSALLGKEDFCKYWPTAKEVLEVLVKVPALNLLALLLIAAGDAYCAKKSD